VNQILVDAMDNTAKQAFALHRGIRRRLRAISEIGMLVALVVLSGLWVRSLRVADQIEIGSFRIILFSGIARFWYVPPERQPVGWYSVPFEPAESRMFAEQFRADTAWPIGFRTSPPPTVGGAYGTGFYVKYWLVLILLLAILSAMQIRRRRQSTKRGFDVTVVKR
jgi:hypothetical protein